MYTLAHYAGEIRKITDALDLFLYRQKQEKQVNEENNRSFTIHSVLRARNIF